MKKKISDVRSKKVTMRLNQAEYTMLTTLYKKSTCRQLSQYLRKVGLQKPVTIKYRNESADEILSVLLKLKKELNALGNNFNQAVHKLHTLDRIPEFRTWIMIYENSRQTVEKNLTDIKEFMEKIYRQLSSK